MAEVQTRIPAIKLPLGRVGVGNVRKLIKIPRQGKRPIILLVDFNCFVDLPSFQKGIHMSRNLEAIDEVLEEVVKNPVYELEGLCADIVQEVLKRHEYATRCEVEMESKLMTYGRTPSGTKTQDFIKLLAKAEAQRGGAVRKEVGAELRGVVLHPYSAKGSGKGVGYTQRAVASLILQVPEKRFVKIEDIMRVLEGSMSSRAYTFLSEAEEQEVIAEVSEGPKFVDGVVESILAGVAARFASYPPGMKVTARCVAEEPLFHYNSFAERVTTLGKLLEG